MMRTQYLVAIATLSLILTGCSGISGTKDLVPDHPPSELYAAAQKKLQDGNFKGAITQLEALDNRYPFGPYSQQVQLDLIYAYYKSADLPLAQASIDRFIRLNPTHPDIDYVLYVRGLTNMALDDSVLQIFFGVDRSDRDPQHARIAFHDFRQLAEKYPDSQYATDANKRLIFLKNRLASYELSVVKFYTRREAYVAVINRAEQMIKDYPDTRATKNALILMENAYKKLGLMTQAGKVAEFTAANQSIINVPKTSFRTISRSRQR